MQPSFTTRLKSQVSPLNTGKPVEIGGKGLKKKNGREGRREGGKLTKQPRRENELKLVRDGPLFFIGGGTFFVKKLFASCSWLKKIVCFKVMN